MTRERWQRVEEIAQAVPLRDACARARFRDDVCGGDDARRRDVESLLARPASEEAVLGEPAVITAAHA